MRGKSLKLFFTVSLLTLLPMLFMGCVTHGNKRIANENLVSQIKEGQSTHLDVRRLLGESEQITFKNNGEEIWSYSHSNYQANPVALIPCVGLFVSNQGKHKAYYLNIYFAKDGVVKKIDRTGGRSKLGALSGY
jgi:hypothetical protein